MTVDCLNDAAAVIDITNESGEEIMLEGKDSWNTDKVGCKWSCDVRLSPSGTKAKTSIQCRCQPNILVPLK